MWLHQGSVQLDASSNQTSVTPGLRALRLANA